MLTLRFPRQGDVKGFQGSKYEDLLKQAITAMFGINVVIRSVTGGGDAPSPGRPPSRPVARTARAQWPAAVRKASRRRRAPPAVASPSPARPRPADVPPRRRDED